MADLTEREQKDLRIILVHIFGQEASTWKMNTGTLSATGKMLAANRTCSKAIDVTPRPAGFMPDLSYLRRQLRDMARRAINHDGIYEACQYGGAYNWKQTIYLASEGMYP